jgi:hypothetical protein
MDAAFCVPILKRVGRRAMRKRNAYILGLLVAFAIGMLAGMAFSFRGLERVGLTSLSPDEKTRVLLVELTFRIDRNFELRLENVDHAGEMRTVFRSPDEGRPEGSERILWSGDGRQFILLGRHFFVDPNAVLPTGEQLYLHYNLDTGELRCNATQAPLTRLSIDAARRLGGAAGGI